MCLARLARLALEALGALKAHQVSEEHRALGEPQDQWVLREQQVPVAHKVSEEQPEPEVRPAPVGSKVRQAHPAPLERLLLIPTCESVLNLLSKPWRL